MLRAHVDADGGACRHGVEDGIGSGRLPTSVAKFLCRIRCATRGWDGLAVNIVIGNYLPLRRCKFNQQLCDRRWNFLTLFVVRYVALRDAKLFGKRRLGDAQASTDGLNWVHATNISRTV